MDFTPFLSEQTGAFDDVSELADVARPVVSCKKAAGGSGDTEAGTEPGKKAIDEAIQVVQAVPQRWEQYGKDGQAVVEIFPEPVGLYGSFQVRVRGSDHAAINL